MSSGGHGLVAAELPVACTLNSGDGAARLRRWQSLAEKSPPQARQRGNRLEVWWRLGANDALELEALAAAERECCSFVSWTVSCEGADSILTVTADPRRPDDVTAIGALFGAT